jgi:hypothetical protein
MASPQNAPCASESNDSIPQESQPPQPEPPPPSIPAVPRRVQELREPKNSPQKNLKARSKEKVPRDHRRPHPSSWREEVISNLKDSESFSNRIAILKILRRIPELKDHVVQLVSNNPVDRTYTVRYTRRELIPFDDEARWLHLSYHKIQDLKRQLYKFVKLMYKNGVRYNLYSQHLYLYRPVSWDRTCVLFLASVTHSDLLSIGQLDWKEQRDRVWAQINRIFASLEIWALQEQAASMADDAKEQMDWATSTINDHNIAIDTAKADMTEAQAVMAEAYEMMKQAYASIEKVTAASRGIYDSVISLRYAWDRAHVEKELAETNFKRIELLNSRADTLIQKYGDPKSNSKSLMGGLISHPSSTKPDEKVERKNTSNFSIDDVAAEHEISTDNAGSKKDVGLAT